MDSYPHYAGNCVTRFPKEFDRKSRLQAISLTREDSLLVSSLARGLLLFLTVWLIAATLLVAHPKIVPGRVPGPAPDSPDYAYGAAALLMGHYEVEWPGVGGERRAIASLGETGGMADVMSGVAAWAILWADT